MKKLKFMFLAGLTTLLSGCCHCMEDFPMLKVEFRNYSPEELKSVYILSSTHPDTCFNCVDTVENLGFIGVNPYTSYQVKSDSIPLNKTIQVNKIRSEKSRFFLCDPCRTVTGIDYELDGDKYTSEPIVITK